MARRTSIVKELWLFMRAHRAYWMAPIVVVTLVLAVLMTLAATGAGPFVYSLF